MPAGQGGDGSVRRSLVLGDSLGRSGNEMSSRFYHGDATGRSRDGPMPHHSNELGRSGDWCGRSGDLLGRSGGSSLHFADQHEQGEVGEFFDASHVAKSNPMWPPKHGVGTVTFIDPGGKVAHGIDQPSLGTESKRTSFAENDGVRLQHLYSPESVELGVHAGGQDVAMRNLDFQDSMLESQDDGQQPEFLLDSAGQVSGEPYNAPSAWEWPSQVDVSWYEEEERTGLRHRLEEKRQLLSQSLAACRQCALQLIADPSNEDVLRQHEEAEIEVAGYQAEVAVLIQTLQEYASGSQ